MGISTFLNGRDPVQLRGLAWLSLSDVGIIQTRTGTSDSGGGATVTWTNAGTVACRIDPYANASGIVGGRVDETSTHRVTVPSDAVVVATDRFSITGRGTYEVTAVHERTGAWLHTFEVIQIS